MPSHPTSTWLRASMAIAFAVQASGAFAETAKAPVAKAAAPQATVARAALTSAPVSPLCSRVVVAPLVQIPVGKSTVLRPASPVTRILLGNPENARAARPAESGDAKKDDAKASTPMDTRPGVADVDVLLLAPTEVYLLGKSVGSTNVVMLDRTGTCTAFDVVVAMDTTALQAVIGQLLPAEKDVRITAAFDSIVLSGMVSDGEALTRVTDLANAYVHGGKDSLRVVNMIEVGAPQQVMLEVKVAEISKALLDQFGIDFSRAAVSGDGSMLRFLSGIFGGATGLLGQVSGIVNAQVGGGVIGLATNGQSTSGYSGQAGNPAFGDNPTIPLAPGKSVTTVVANMQKTDGLVKILAEPTVMAISGQTGSFLAGGKIFIPVSQDNGVGGRTITLEEKEFGVSVKFTPTVLGGGRINLRVRPEVSELSATGVQISSGGINAVLPSFTSRKAETTVQLMDGQSFAIGGLIKNNTTTNIKAFPFLGEIPVVGALFRSTQFQTDRSELVFVITPRLVKPLPTGFRLPTDAYVPPSRSELILGGKLEGTPSDTPLAAELPPTQGGFDQEKK
jgi:pilus assembly protein CpaC